MALSPLLRQAELRKLGAGSEIVRLELDVSSRLYCIDAITVYDVSNILTLVRIVITTGVAQFPFFSAINVGAGSIVTTPQRIFIPSPCGIEAWCTGGAALDPVILSVFGYASE